MARKAKSKKNFRSILQGLAGQWPERLQGMLWCFGRGAKKPRAAGLRGRGKGLLLHNGHSKGVGTAIDGFVGDCDFQAGDGREVNIVINVAEKYLRLGQI